MSNLFVGDLILDNHGRECLVFAREMRPSTEWLAEQDDSRIREVEGPWWKAMPLSGGSVIVPNELGAVVRRANVDDLLKLVESQSSEAVGQAMLAELFQQLQLIA